MSAGISKWHGKYRPFHLRQTLQSRSNFSSLTLSGRKSFANASSASFARMFAMFSAIMIEKMDFGPRHMIKIAGLAMHPMDDLDRVKLIKEEGGIGFCNITKCCTEVCPEHIKITDNGIIPMKERVVDRYYDPIMRILNILSPDKK